MAVTPMMAQYLSVKEQYPNAILFFRLGDFYEMFYDDAKLVSRELELTLTRKNCGEPEPAPMCGIPYHSADAYIGRLVALGHKVVICEQTEDPATAKGLVRRDVVRVVTSGTLIESNLLQEGKNNYLCAIVWEPSAAAVCFVDVSTGDIDGTVLRSGDVLAHTINELASHGPSEILLSVPRDQLPELTSFITTRLNAALVDTLPEAFETESSSARIEKQFQKTPQELGLDDILLTRAVSALLYYISEAQKTDVSYIRAVRIYHTGQYVEIDATTRRSLEICETMRSREKKGSLLWVLDRTKTSMGARLLRRILDQPLCSIPAIQRRQEAVRFFVSDYALREEIGELLRGVSDLERLLTKVAYGSVNARDLRAIGVTLAQIPRLRTLLTLPPQDDEKIMRTSSSEIDAIVHRLDPLEELTELLSQALTDTPPILVREGGMIRDGWNDQVDKLREIIHSGTSYKDKMEAEEREKTGIRTLKIGYNRVFGYYIEVSNSFKDQVPAHYIRKQTLTGGERYITEELKKMESTILGASDKLQALEYELFCQIRSKTAEMTDRITQNALCLAQLDVYRSLAEVAAINNYICPEVDYSDIISIRGGRHPVVEQCVPGGTFVPNDTLLDHEHNRLLLITGPNMAGKSTYMRQVALIVLMAQIGSFVPAEDARIGIADKLFTRIGASDDLAAGQSTFMLEMQEVAGILRAATARSLILYDEIGRGTSTFDGMSIARAVAEYTLGKKIGARTLFATHYHELTALAEECDGVVNYSIAAKKRGDDLIFLRKILRGAADDSYGIEVAQLAGVPREVIRRAKQILQGLEERSEKLQAAIDAALPQEEKNEITLADLSAAQIQEKLKCLDVDTLSPREALDVLYELKRMVL